MSDLNVELTLRLQQNIQEEAKKANVALKSIADEAGKLGKVGGADKLESDLKDVEGAARRAKGEVNNTRAAADRLNKVKTDKAEKEIDALGNAAVRNKDKMGRLVSTAREAENIGASKKLGLLASSMGNLHGVVWGLAAGLGAAFTAPDIIGGIGRMKDAADQLEQSLTRVMLIEGEITPARMEEVSERNETLGVQYGMRQADILSAQQTLATGGVVGADQDALLEPILKAAKASGSQPETIALAVRALVQNLGLDPKDASKALDRMLLGGKLGSFELEDMARSFPELASGYAQSGRQGLGAAEELIAMGQVVRTATGSSGEAGTALREILSKVFSPETIKRMGENGIDVQAIAEQAQTAGEPLVISLIEAIKEKGLTDSFGLGELVADYNARLALQALTTNLDMYNDILKSLRKGSDGAVDNDLSTIMDLSATKGEQRAAALQATGRSIGEVVSPVVNFFMDTIARVINKDFAKVRTNEELRERLKRMDDPALEAQMARLKGIPKQVVRADVQQMISEQIAIVQKEMTARESKRLAVPELDSSAAPLGVFNKNLQDELSKAEAQIRAAVTRMERRLDFSASPVISPVIRPPSTVGGAPVQKMSAPGGGGGGGGGASTINVNGARSPEQTAMAIERRQNRQIALARNNALHDTGALA